MDGVGRTGRLRFRFSLRDQRRSARSHARPHRTQRRDAPALETFPQGPEEGRRPLNKLPNTTTGKTGDRSRVGPVLAAVGFMILLLAAFVSVWPGDFSPGEELISPGAKDIAVSQEDKAYPTSDRLRFAGGAEAVYVYLMVEDFATYENLGARVGRTSRVSALGRLLGGGGALVVSNEGEERLSVVYGGGGCGGEVC